jgi:hypothetical protein
MARQQVWGARPKTRPRCGQRAEDALLAPGMLHKPLGRFTESHHGQTPSMRS